MGCVFVTVWWRSPSRPSPLGWSQNWKTNVASSHRTAATVRRRRPGSGGLGGWGTVPLLRVLNPGRRPIRCGQACLDCPQWTPDGPYHCWPMARGHARGKENQTTKPPSAILHHQLPPHLRFPSRHFLLLPLPVASVVPSIYHPAPAASPETYQGPIFRSLLLSFPVAGLTICPTAPSFDSRPILCLFVEFRLARSCFFSRLFSPRTSLCHRFKDSRRDPPQRPPNGLLFAPSSEFVCFSLDHHDRPGLLMSPSQ